MKKLVFILACVFILGCEYRGEDSIPPFKQDFEFSFTNLKVAKNLTISIECLERKQKIEKFFLSGIGTQNYKSENNCIVIPKEEILKLDKVMSCEVRYYPYYPIGVHITAREPNNEPPLTCLFRIYKDDKLLFEKELQYPKKRAKTIKIDL
ncbi:MAG: hypothetical protein KGV44_14055 [Flavobacteriaceae bacterium]|nr:hypothetical protein [Flavobacteriaceae bacterium]